MEQMNSDYCVLCSVYSVYGTAANKGNRLAYMQGQMSIHGTHVTYVQFAYGNMEQMEPVQYTV